MASSFFQFATAAPGTLANEPLQTSARAEPNVMFMIDTSGSMNNVVPDAPYDATTDYTPAGCGSTITETTTTSVIYLKIASAVPKIRYSSTDYDLTDRCFDRTRSYSAKLNADNASDSNNKTTSGYLQGKYTGNFLNWYFSSTDNTSTWTNQSMKPASGVNSRMNISKTAVTELVSGLSNMRIGLASFNGGDGGYIERNVQTLTTTHKANLVSSISGLSGSGSTPVAETLLDIGRYFVGSSGTANPGGLASGSTNESNGQYNGDLTMHPEWTTPIVDNDGDIFNHTPSYRSGLTSASPIQYWCQQNFAILLTDGRPQSDTGPSGTTYTVAAVRDYDQDCTGVTPSCDSYDKKPAGTVGANGGTYGYESNGSDYMDDVAGLLYDIDLRPDIDDYNGDEVKNNIVTYTIGFADDQVINDPLMYDTAFNGGGEFKTAANASKLKEAFNSATQSIIDATSSSSAVTFNSSNLSSNSAIYQALFNTVRWSGEINSFPLDGVTGQIKYNCVKGVDASCWSASESMDNQDHADRQIMTLTSGNKGIEFVTPSDYTALTSSTLPAALIDDLCEGVDIPYPCNTSTTADATKKAANQTYMGQLLDYLRGDRSREGQSTTPSFRQRTSVLGDIVNASPIFVGEPVLHNQRPGYSPFPTGTDAYYKWAETTAIKNRTSVVYASSNDGMLHAINAADGSEMMAYIPTSTFSNNATYGLHYLADPTYNHRFYSDLTPSISDVWMKHRNASGALTSSPAWRTVLLGGQRLGGRSLFLLDVTDPSKFADVDANADEIALWEFTHDDLGFSFSKPTITMMNNGKFAAVFGNGYNSGLDGGSGDCEAKLFIVYLEAGVDGSWAEAGDYQVLETKSGGPGADCNGLSSPTLVDLNHDGTTDRVYAGDLHGNMWAFDLCNLSNGNPKVCQGSGWEVGYGNTSTPEPMMIAKDKSNVVQPITVKPAVSLDPKSTGTTDVIVAFGTGQYLTADDLTSTQLNSIYAVREQDALDNGNGVNKSMDPRTKFSLQTYRVKDCTPGVYGDATNQLGCGDDPKDGDLEGRLVVQPSTPPNDRGWMIDLYDDRVTEADNSGERNVVNPIIVNNILFINSLIPDKDTCGVGGDGWAMAFKLIDGDEPDDPVWDVHQDGIFDVKDRIGTEAISGIRIPFPGQSTILGPKMYTPCGQGGICINDINVEPSQREGRMSWKELYETQ